tara:strand:+ start:961 stop:1413 length:453 start_codon:yes stop_codon:yes gene_type:complete
MSLTLLKLELVERVDLTVVAQVALSIKIQGKRAEILTSIQQERHIHPPRFITFVQMVVDVVVDTQQTIMLGERVVMVEMVVGLEEVVQAPMVEVSKMTPIYQIQEHKVILVEIVDLTTKVVAVVDTLRQGLEELAAVLLEDVVVPDLIAQ